MYIMLNNKRAAIRKMTRFLSSTVSLGMDHRQKRCASMTCRQKALRLRSRWGDDHARGWYRTDQEALVD